MRQDDPLAGQESADAPGARAPGDTPEARELEALRRLIVGPEQSQIGDLQSRLRDLRLTPAQVSRVLAKAVSLTVKKGDSLSTALSPTIENALQASVKRNPKALADAIFPILGPAIRKSIRHTFTSLIQTINQTVEHTFTVKGLRWRLQAMRSGRPFAEIVLKNSLVYRVEQVFLLHKENGLLLAHVALPAIEMQDPDLVSSMLSAIQDFVRDSFGGEQARELDQFQVGDLTVTVERGPHAVLAAAVRGIPPGSLNELMQESLEDVHADLGAELASFQGDTAVFASCEPTLQACLLEQRKPKKKGWVVPLLLAAVFLFFGLQLLIWFFNDMELRKKSQAYLGALEKEPGIVVVDSEVRDGQLHLVGLKDRRAPDLQRIRDSVGLRADLIKSRWEFFDAHHPEIALPRAREILRPPSSVALALKDRILQISGMASWEWARRMRTLTQALPGVDRVEADSLRIAWPASMSSLVAEANKLRIAPPPEGVLSPELAAQAAQLLLDSLRALDIESAVRNAAVEVQVTWRDAPGATPIARERARRWASTIHRHLRARTWMVTSFSDDVAPDPGPHAEGQDGTAVKATLREPKSSGGASR